MWITLRMYPSLYVLPSVRSRLRVYTTRHATHSTFIPSMYTIVRWCPPPCLFFFQCKLLVEHSTPLYFPPLLFPSCCFASSCTCTYVGKIDCFCWRACERYWYVLLEAATLFAWWGCSKQLVTLIRVGNRPKQPDPLTWWITYPELLPDLIKTATQSIWACWPVSERCRQKQVRELHTRSSRSPKRGVGEPWRCRFNGCPLA